MTSYPTKNGVIGVFDSGVGGLTVVRRIWEVLPCESILFVADQAHVPYGGRPLDEVSGFARGISAAILNAHAKSVIMACNISTATALDEVRTSNPDHVIVGVIGPGAAAAAAVSSSRSIGVLATTGTVSTHAYRQAINTFDPAIHVTEVACPDFVPLIESERTESSDAFAAAAKYLGPILEQNADVVILGCTHYPFLLPALKKAAPHICFIDPAEQATSELAQVLVSRQLSAEDQARPSHQFFTTGDTDTFARQIGFFLPNATTTPRVGQAEWRGGRLCLG